MTFLSSFDHGDLMTVDAFRETCDCGGFIDYDGFGYAVFGDRVDTETFICPSKREEISDLATHVLWFNR